MLSSAMRDGVQSLRSLSADDVLAVLGLEKRRSTFPDVIVPSLALFAAGAVVGAAAAVLLAPKSGAALRRDLTDGAKDIGQRLGTTAQAVQDYVGVHRANASSANAT
jgi:hypothetical protein